MMKILVDAYGCCQSKYCKFRRECANHESAGDFRGESGFTPQIFVDDEKENEFFCSTCDETSSDYYNKFVPCNEINLSHGFVPIKYKWPLPNKLLTVA